jgi:hypothetical protein
MEKSKLLRFGDYKLLKYPLRERKKKSIKKMPSKNDVVLKKKKGGGVFIFIFTGFSF